MPKVSFIMPAFKHRFLKEAIDSILAQTCREFELVIVDDKSPEELYCVLQEYSWESSFDVLPDGGRHWIVDGISVRYYQNAENIGNRDLVAAWHHAIEYATGEWCVLASDDDIYLPGYLAEMLRLRDKYPTVDLIHCRICDIDTIGTWIDVAQERTEFESQIQMFNSVAVKHLRQVAPDFMFRLDALRKIGGFVNFPLAWGSDDATWIALSVNGVACSSKILFAFRKSGINITTRTDNVDEKFIARVSYYEWMKVKIVGFVAKTQEEEYLLKRANAMLETYIIDEAVRMSKNMSFGFWLKVFRKSFKSFSNARRLLYARYPRLYALRMLLPRFR